MAIKFENIQGRMSAPPMHFNIIDLYCLDRKIVKNKVLASISILLFLGSKMINISELGTDFG